MPRDDYNDRQERRRERYEARAARATMTSAQAFKRADSAIEGIPPGQPILVGHHSEARHRRDLARHDSAMRQGIAESKKADHYANKAASVGRAGISSDDPDAPGKIAARIERLEKNQAFMRDFNALWRKCGKPAPANAEAWQPIYDNLPAGCTAEMVNKIRQGMAGDPLNRGPFPDYELTNNNANIRRLKQRLAQLQREAEAEPVTEERDGLTIVENVEENRVQIIFPGKPPAEVRAILKRQGFRWARSAGAWQRLLNNAGRYAARYAADRIAALDA